VSFWIVAVDLKEINVRGIQTGKGGINGVENGGAGEA
jgi:hypothetical protein